MCLGGIGLAGRLTHAVVGRFRWGVDELHLGAGRDGFQARQRQTRVDGAIRGKAGEDRAALRFDDAEQFRGNVGGDLDLDATVGFRRQIRA